MHVIEFKRVEGVGNEGPVQTIVRAGDAIDTVVRLAVSNPQAWVSGAAAAAFGQFGQSAAARDNAAPAAATGVALSIRSDKADEFFHGRAPVDGCDRADAMRELVHSAMAAAGGPTCSVGRFAGDSVCAPVVWMTACFPIADSSARGMLVIMLETSEDAADRLPREELVLFGAIAAATGARRWVRMRSAQQVLLGRLSQAQRRVAPLLIDGLSEREVAKAISRSPHTVHDHVKAIYSTWGVGSRADMRAMWLGEKVELHARRRRVRGGVP